jgi:integrase
MAGRATYDLSNKTARARLKVRSKAYFTSLAPRLSLGWSRASKGEAGRWIRREETGRDDAGGPIYKTKTLDGVADDIGVADAKVVLSFQHACRVAANPLAPADDRPLTVARALEAHRKAKQGRSRHADADYSRLLRHLPPQIRDAAVIKLTKAATQDWQNSLVKEDTDHDPDARRRSQDTGNRLRTILFSALNYAADDDANGISDRPWMRVKPFKAVGKAREMHFSEPEVLKWIEAANAIDPALADLIESGFHSGCRFGELQGCTVGCFDSQHAHLNVPSGKTGARTIMLPAEAVAFFRRITAGRANSEPLIVNAAGQRWNKNTYSRGLKAALRAAGLDDRASFYTLRHSHASRRIERGQPLLLVAAELGTSTRMLETVYGKFLQEGRRKLIEDTAPSLRLVNSRRDAA